MVRAVRASLVAAAAFAWCAAAPAEAQQSDMSFFVTSAGPGKGADLGGLAGADRQCKILADRVGAGSKTWHAYLSTQGPDAVNARDRIGKGPWKNVKGVVIAKDVANLHGDNNLNKQTALTETGGVVNGYGDKPNMHDILTGTQADGTAFPAGEDRTCHNWTSSDEGSAMLGHSDRSGPNDLPGVHSWNAAHPSRGCSQAGLISTGGNGLLYCFAAE